MFMDFSNVLPVSRSATFSLKEKKQQQQQFKLPFVIFLFFPQHSSFSPLPFVPGQVPFFHVPEQ